MYDVAETMDINDLLIKKWKPNKNALSTCSTIPTISKNQSAKICQI